MVNPEDPAHRYYLAWATALTAALNAVRYMRSLPIDAELDDESVISAALAAGIASMATDMQGLNLSPYLVCQLARTELAETNPSRASNTRATVHKGNPST